MGAFKDLTGQRFGRLVVIKQAEPYKRKDGAYRARWECQCDCGNTCIVLAENLHRGSTQSCGCLRKERMKGSHKRKNEYTFYKDIGWCITPIGQAYTFDAEDYEKLAPYLWTSTIDGYARTNINGKTTTMHRIIMDCSEGMCVDHLDGNKYNNCKSNLEVVTYAENEQRKWDKIKQEREKCTD